MFLFLLIGYPYNPINNPIRLDTTYALETVYRINVGGDDISPKSDTGMFRTWIKDDQYLYGAADGQLAYDYGLQVKYTPMVPAYTAPDLVYRTARFMGFDSRINLNFNLSWFFPVETGFLYLVRLHFCELDRNMTKINKKVFSIYMNNDMNNETAQPQADVIGWSGGQGVPVYKDYVVMIPQGKNGIQDLWLDLHPSTETRPQYYQSFLNGVEIFRLNYYGGNLAVPNNPQLQYHEGPLVNSSSISSSTISSKKRLAKIIGGSAGGLVMAFIIVCSLAFWIRVANERAKKKNKSPFRYFTMKEIKAATNNFDEGRIIGTGGFGVVYKGYIDGETTTVAVKRSNKAQGHNEFQSEIKTLSLLRHQNVVSLMGYCSDEQEMILVYEYMPKGTLFEHLHFSDEQQKMPLSWNQRLHICIGAAQGLCYLHTGMKFQIVHRDVKTSNILLDENWVAKIADFGLSKIDPTNGSTKVMGSIGYIDPEYCRLLKLTDKSDVYSFGVVLLEVLSAKFVVNYNCNDNEENEDAVSFVEWALNCYEKGDLENLIDPHLEGKITPASLAKFMEITQKCLAEQGLDRPSISQVLWSLELALELQIHGNSEDRKVISGNSDLTLGVEFSEIMMPIGR
ncbi:receptor-like protein kinase FERONIA [Jatropha curcas]|uniref:receptor-like protein kinase FERONIA n=1 Tax=Jatropha curcas TaxID=180498 RepID=UPI00189429EC|nr:receptor-like protein kinase FERONIA [Jatropha curcas]